MIDREHVREHVNAIRRVSVWSLDSSYDAAITAS
jgi:hypothetical protein